VPGIDASTTAYEDEAASTGVNAEVQNTLISTIKYRIAAVDLLRCI
jgi:hypothetical protein